MNPNHLDGRLSCCASLVRQDSRLVDIGTDHGLLPIALVSAGVVEEALACDINPAPLKSAEENIRRCGLEEKIRTRLSDGLERVDADEADDVVIAGMGGELIAEIIEKAPWLKDEKKHLILQPMTRCEKLLRYLFENGFELIEQKACIAKKKPYTVILSRYTRTVVPFDLAKCYLGALDPSDENAVRFLEATIARLEKQQQSDPSLSSVIHSIKEVIS